MSHHLRRPPRRERLARLLSRAARRLLPTRQAGQTRRRATATQPPQPEATEKQPTPARRKRDLAEEQPKAGGRGADSSSEKQLTSSRRDRDSAEEQLKAGGRGAVSSSERAAAVFSYRATLSYKETFRVVLTRVAGALRRLAPAWWPLEGRPSWSGCDERSADRGAATVSTVGGIAVVMVAFTGVYLFYGAVAARHEAEAAADLGALAAAVTAVGGEQQACAEARWVVERMGAVLQSCRLSGWDALVETEMVYGVFGSAAGRARAGPVELGR